MLLLKYILNKIGRFHGNQKGLQTLEVVMILALVAIVGMVIYGIGRILMEFARECLEGTANI